MNKKIEEAIERLNNFKNITILYSNIVAMNVQELKRVQQDIETLVQELENSIPKEVVEEKIKYVKEEGYWEFTTDRDADKCVDILQELLQEKGENKDEFKYKV